MCMEVLYLKSAPSKHMSYSCTVSILVVSSELTALLECFGSQCILHLAVTDGGEVEGHCTAVWEVTVTDNWAAIRKEKHWEEKPAGRPPACKL